MSSIKSENAEAKVLDVPMLYWKSNSFKELSKLHAKYDLPKFYFSVLLYRAIRNKNLKFATELVLNNYIPHLCIPENFQCEPIPYLQDLITLCIEKNDLVKLNLLSDFSIMRHANYHKWKNEIQLSNQSGNAYIKPLIEENMTYSSKTNDSFENICFCDVGHDIRLFWRFALRAAVKTDDVRIIETIIRNYPFDRFSKSSEDHKELSPLVHKLIDKKNYKLLDFIGGYTYYIKETSKIKKISKYGNYTKDIISKYIKNKSESKNEKKSNEHRARKKLSEINYIDHVDEFNIKEIDIRVFEWLFTELKNELHKEKIDSIMMGINALYYHEQRAEYAVMAEKNGRDDILSLLLNSFAIYNE